MITTVADLLRELIDREVKIIEKQPDLNHMPMLGDMYEGLAREALSRAVFANLGLKVVEGKARYTDTTLSAQVDCMIVIGDGDRLPHTNHYIYSITQVIAVIEVKKTLYGNALEDSFIHLRGIYDPSYPYNKGLARLAVDAWRSITAKPYPKTGETLTKRENMLRHVINVFTHQPIRIVMGYDGFQSEYTLREGMCRFLSTQTSNNKTSKAGFGPTSFPNLIICKNASIIRLDGMPYSGPIDEDEYWNFLASSSTNPFLILLEILWTRICYLHNISSSIFGEDLSLEVFSRFIDARLTSKDGLLGWEYKYEQLSTKTLKTAPEAINWEPQKLTVSEFVIVNSLCQGNEVSPTDSKLREFLSAHGTNLDELIASLSKKHLVGRVGDRIELLTKECTCAIIGGDFYAAENNTGRFTRWHLKQMERNNRSTSAPP